MWPFGIGNKYPYTDFHELNTDYLIEKTGKIDQNLKDSETAREGAEAAQAAAETAQAAAETAQAAAETAQEGAEAAEENTEEYYNNLQTHIANDVTSWLEANVDPVGSAVVVDSSLSISGAAADAKVTGDTIKNLKADLDIDEIVMNENHGIPINYDLGGSVDYLNPVSRNDVDCAVVSCHEGDKFTINAKGGNTYRAFAFIDSSSAVLYQVKPHGAGEYITIENGIIEAPENAAYLIINNINDEERISFKGVLISETVNDIDAEINNEEIKINPFFSLGSLSGAGNYSIANLNRICTQLFIDVTDYDYIETEIASGYRIYYQFYTSPHPAGVVSNTGWVTESQKIPMNYPYVRIICATVGDDPNVSPSDFNTYFNLTVHYKNFTLENTINEQFSPAANASQNPVNSGINFKVMTYNVANYNNDTTTYMNNNQLLEFRKMLDKANADVVCLQENGTYIDGTTKTSQEYIYLPKYPQKHGTAGVVLYHKTQSVDGAGHRLTFSNGRDLRYSTFQLSNDIKLLVVNTHMVFNYQNTGGTSDTSINARRTQYAELFNWINGTIDLTDIETSNPVHVPSHTHCIICMDSNCVTNTDKENLASIASNNDFILGNGGYLGWFLTELRFSYSIDEIIVSDNIIINNIEAWSALYSKLYSDHVPVIADLTLL